MKLVGLLLGALAGLAACFVLLLVLPISCRTIEEEFVAPQEVRSWTTDGLLLAGGETVPLPGVSALPRESPLLSEAIRRGVEIRPDGQVFAQVRIWHWCGNDPIRHHLARVDLSHALRYFGHGEPIPDNPWSRHHEPDEHSAFRTGSWNISDYLHFRQAWGLVDYQERMTPDASQLPENQAP